MARPSLAKVGISTTKTYRTMGYIQAFEHEFRELLQQGDEQAIVRFAKEKLLESYRNGITAAKPVEKEAEQKTKRFAKGK